MNLFRVCEDLENMDGLHMIFKIVRGISQYSIFFAILIWILFCRFCIYSFLWRVCYLAVLLNSPPIFERIFKDEFIVDIIGALECKCILQKLISQLSDMKFSYLVVISYYYSLAVFLLNLKIFLIYWLCCDIPYLLVAVLLRRCSWFNWFHLNFFILFCLLLLIAESLVLAICRWSGNSLCSASS